MKENYIGKVKIVRPDKKARFIDILFTGDIVLI